MKTSRIRKVVAGFALAVAALVAVPAAAQANGGTSYPPNDSYITPPASQVIPGGTVSLSFAPGSFAPGQTVSFTLSGENAAGATLATFFTVVNDKSLNKAAAGDGSLATSVALPTNAAGTYTLTATTTGWSRTWTFTVAGSAAGGAGTGLATTGAAGDQLLWAWVAGGALAFAGGGVLVASAVRKQRKLAA